MSRKLIGLAIPNWYQFNFSCSFYGATEYRWHFLRQILARAQPQCYRFLGDVPTLPSNLGWIASWNFLLPNCRKFQLAIHLRLLGRVRTSFQENDTLRLDGPSALHWALAKICRKKCHLYTVAPSNEQLKLNWYQIGIAILQPSNIESLKVAY